MDPTAELVIVYDEVEAISLGVHEFFEIKASENPKHDGSWFLFQTFAAALWPKPAEMKRRPRLATGRWPAGPALGATPLHTVVTYRLTFMAQHALLDFLGQDQEARLQSGPESVRVQPSPVLRASSLPGLAKQKCSVIGRTK